MNDMTSEKSFNLVEALKFYSDPLAYSHQEFGRRPPAVIEDDGQRARDAIVAYDAYCDSQVERLVIALRKIEGMNFPFSSTMAAAGAWHAIVVELQCIAKEALQ